MLSLPPSIEQLFLTAGWRPHPTSKSVDADNANSEGLATAILRQFAALHVGEIGSGVEQAKSDISFYSQLRPTVSAVTSPWRLQVGNCAAFATAHNDHMILFVNDQGRYFVFTDPDSCLYPLGDSFGNAMLTLLLGYKFASPLARDS
ncbi:SUKH-3 domain-containing protein [Comamonas sp. MYb21]|uniref:SUKH-3 domain-containing protein n=1 Tax=unclassified Comamonas TaxID=2638500 RepID=UPI00403FB0EB